MVRGLRRCSGVWVRLDVRSVAAWLLVVGVLTVPLVEGAWAAREARAYRATSIEPVVLQSHPAGCGAALLATILAWRGSPVPEAALLATAPPGPEGITLKTFLDLAGMHGLVGVWRRAPRRVIPEGVFVAHFDRPYGHFVWVVEQAGAYLHVIDPQRGPGVWHVDRFLARFSGRYLKWGEGA